MCPKQWSDAGVDDLASRLYRVSAVNTDERVSRRSPWARLAPMTLKEHLRPRAHQHFENADDLNASSHSVTVAVELANPAPGRRVHVRIVTQGVLVATQVHEPGGTGFTAMRRCRSWSRPGGCSDPATGSWRIWG